MDIEKCFDQISHETILEKTELPKIALKGLRLAIKAGVRGEFPTSTAGTPQGGVISPLLANIALNGIEEVTDGIYKRINHKVLCLRYADDLVFICKPEHNIALVKEQASKFLEERGLKIKRPLAKVILKG
jgi:retron-type reverse transcriptase